MPLNGILLKHKGMCNSVEGIGVNLNKITSKPILKTNKKAFSKATFKWG